MKRLAILFGLFVLIVIVLADSGRLGIARLLNRLPYGDKAGHFFLFGILTLLIDAALLRSHPHLNRRLLVSRVALTLALFIGLEEFSQRYFSARSFDLVDLLFSYLGVVFFSLLALKQ